MIFQFQYLLCKLLLDFSWPFCGSKTSFQVQNSEKVFVIFQIQIPQCIEDTYVYLQHSLQKDKIILNAFCTKGILFEYHHE